MMQDNSKQYIVIDSVIYNRENSHILLEKCVNTKCKTYEDLYHFIQQWTSSEPTFILHTSGSTGQPKQIKVSKQSMINSAQATLNFFGIKPFSNILLCMNLRHVGAVMVAVRAIVGHLNIVVSHNMSNPLCDVNQKIALAPMVALQMYNTLSDNVSKRNLELYVDNVIIGGSAIMPDLEERLRHTATCRVYSSYGMTETLSHIALRKINSYDYSNAYTTLDGIEISLSSNNTLSINAPHICSERIETNDVVDIIDPKTFVVRGRIDNVVNSGGVKIQIEEVEDMLRKYIDFPFALTSLPSDKYGEELVMLVAVNKNNADVDLKELKHLLPKYHCPKVVYRVDEIPYTENGKIDRYSCKQQSKQLSDK